MVCNIDTPPLSLGTALSSIFIAKSSLTGSFMLYSLSTGVMVPATSFSNILGLSRTMTSFMMRRDSEIRR